MPHIHEKIDLTVETFIVHGGKVFLRMHDKYHIWLTPGGHVELDEDPNEAAVREAKEEAGLDIVLCGTKPDFKELPEGGRMIFPPRFVYRHHITPVHEHTVFIYFATTDSDKITVSGSDRSDDWKWFTAEELEEEKYGVREDIRFYAAAALHELGAKSAKQ